MRHVTVMTGGRRHREWTDEERLVRMIGADRAECCHAFYCNEVVPSTETSLHQDSPLKPGSEGCRWRMRRENLSPSWTPATTMVSLM
jgi:hypothetical protein